MQLSTKRTTGGHQDRRILRLIQQSRILKPAATRRLQAREAHREAIEGGTEVVGGIVHAHAPHAKLAGDGLEVAEARDVREANEAPELDVS